MMDAILTIDDLVVEYGGIRAIDQVSIRLTAGQVTTVVGPNGAGKSTLLRTIMGLVQPKSGEIRLEGRPVTGGPWARPRLGLSLSPENRRLFREMTVQENLEMGGYILSRDQLRRQVDEMFALFPAIAGRRKQLAGTCSGGEQQMIAIGRALMSNPKVLLLDEPSLGLAPMVTERIFALVQELRMQRGVSVLLVEQNVSAALRIADRAYVFEKGRVAMEGTGAEVQSNPHVQAVYLGV